MSQPKLPRSSCERARACFSRSSLGSTFCCEGPPVNAWPMHSQIIGCGGHCLMSSFAQESSQQGSYAQDKGLHGRHLGGVLPDEHHEEDGDREWNQYPVPHIPVQQDIVGPHRGASVRLGLVCDAPRRGEK